MFRKVCDLENQLLALLATALDSTYIADLKNVSTRTITHTIPYMFHYLFKKYGKVKQDKLAEKSHNLSNITYDIEDPPIIVWQDIEELSRLADAADNPYTSRQILEFGESIMLKCSDLESDMKRWFKKPRIDQTWTNFKDHIEDARDAITEVRGPSMKSTQFHHANYMAQQVLTAVQNLDQKINSTIGTSSHREKNSQSETINTTPTDLSSSMMLELMSLIKELRQDIKTNKSVENGTTPQNGNNRQGRRNVNKYCWSHDRTNPRWPYRPPPSED